jgi:hypothetical protein
MRVRSFFWYLFALCCISVLVFAATIHMHAPATMQVRLDQPPPVVSGTTTLELHLADSQGLPIEQAQVVPSARMTNMQMVTKQIQVESLGSGNYIATLQLYMAGPWEISIEAHADGFDSLKQTLLIQVQ